jgi:hypothetical protein
MARLSEHLSGPALAKRSGERVTELLVVGLQSSDAVGGCLQST